MTRHSDLTSAGLKARAAELGFDACGVAPAADLPELAFLPEWLARGYAAGMISWLGRTAHRRGDVRRVLPSTRSVVVTATNYHTDRPFSIDSREPGAAHIARYAWGEDYHRVLTERQEALIAWMRDRAGGPIDALSYVDTGPIQERVYARHAGIGWIGKNCCVISESLGSFLFLGVILTSVELDVDAPALDLCGTCTRCLDACPTRALVAPGVLDSNRCLSYLTIEHRGDLPSGASQWVGTHVYGCDVCQEVCPWNATAPVAADPAWQPRPAWDRRSIADLLTMSDRDLAQALEGSAMRRAKPEGLRRNLRAAAANIGLDPPSVTDAG